MSQVEIAQLVFRGAGCGSRAGDAGAKGPNTSWIPTSYCATQQHCPRRN